MAARRQRQEEEERSRKEAHDSRMAKEYAQNMLERVRMVHARNENIQKFMEVTSHMHPSLFILVVPLSNFLISIHWIGLLNCRVLFSAPVFLQR